MKSVFPKRNGSRSAAVSTFGATCVPRRQRRGGGVAPQFPQGKEEISATRSFNRQEAKYLRIALEIVLQVCPAANADPAPSPLIIVPHAVSLAPRFFSVFLSQGNLLAGCRQNTGDLIRDERIRRAFSLMWQPRWRPPVPKNYTSERVPQHL